MHAQRVFIEICLIENGVSFNAKNTWIIGSKTYDLYECYVRARAIVLVLNDIIFNNKTYWKTRGRY